jgi:hypothetical protein
VQVFNLRACGRRGPVLRSLLIICDNLLTPWSCVLTEKLTVAQLLSKLPKFNGTRSFFTVESSVFWDIVPCSPLKVK